MPAADRFVPLAQWLRPAPPPAPPAPPDPAPVHVEPALVAPADEPPAVAPPPEPGAVAAAERAALRDVRLFRAALAEALDRATAQLVRDLAAAVLGRELQLAPVEVSALAAAILAEHPAATPLVVRHAPGEALDLPVPAVADPALAPGDLVVAFADGSVDARLAVRLAVALEAWA